jgi:hypothetical protein
MKGRSGSTHQPKEDSMKKSLLIVILVLFAAAVFTGCNTEALKKLTEENMTLTLDNASLKAKVADCDKARADLQNQVTMLNAEVGKHKAAAAAAAAAPADDKGAKKDDKGAAKKDDKGAAKKTAAPKKKK